MPKTWLITGASRGFGKEWAIAALERGDSVAATGRKPEDLQDLVDTYGDAVLPIVLDVTDRDGCFAAVAQTQRVFGGLDVVVNNAGYGQFGMVEELSEAELRTQLDTNLFGALWITQAALPILREQGHGHVIQVSSIGGITAVPGIGAYHASKWALEGISQALAAEVKDFGIKVTIIEPGGFSTDWSGPSAKHATAIGAYDGHREARKQRSSANKAGDPTATGAVVLQLVDSEDPPLRVFFGAAPLAMAEADYASRLTSWRSTQDLAEAAQGG